MTNYQQLPCGYCGDSGKLIEPNGTWIWCQCSLGQLSKLAEEISVGLNQPQPIIVTTTSNTTYSPSNVKITFQGQEIKGTLKFDYKGVYQNPIDIPQCGICLADLDLSQVGFDEKLGLICADPEECDIKRGRLGLPPFCRHCGTAKDVHTVTIHRIQEL